jgi:glucose dehydrogenase
MGSTIDGRFRAFDARSRKELWATKIDATAHSIPSTFLGSDASQYVVGANSGTFLKDPTLDALIVFALPEIIK